MKDAGGGGDRTPHYYTMKTITRQASSAAPNLYSNTHTNPLAYPHSHPSTHCHGASSSSRVMKGSLATTPLASPKLSYSVGQASPPKLSPVTARASEARAASPSYFGLVADDTANQRDSSLPIQQNWSPVTVSVKPFTAAIAKHVSLDANPEYEASKRQMDASRETGLGRSMATHVPNGPTSFTTTFIPPNPLRSQTHASDSTVSSGTFSSRAGSVSTHAGSHEVTRMDMDQDNLHDSAYVSGDSKRSSGTCLVSPQFPGFLVTASPEHSQSQDHRSDSTSSSMAEDWNHRSSATGSSRRDSGNQSKGVGPRPTLSGPNDGGSGGGGDGGGGPCMLPPDRLRQMVEDPNVRLLLIDVRTSQTYARSHIRDALNLCIPTTLLKRATFNLEKLQRTFQRPGDEGAFATWRDTHYLVVYDAFSAEKTEATTAMNMIKKFTNEGYTGGTFVLRGGFQKFAEEHPELIYHQATDSTTSRGGGPGPSGLAPVIGGVLLPSVDTPNPFFANIRQNMDLADGVGQMDIARPKGLAPSNLPEWLRAASEESDHGKRVSDKFLRIEMDEQARMRSAYGQLKCSTSPGKFPAVQLCGIEQGDRNRYKDILPFEKTRVKLPPVANQSDYFNASYVKASRSNKRYLATQGPLPTTFDDFWAVVWDQDVRVIVMLTAESEGGQIKCHTYWTRREYGPVRLTMISEEKVSLDVDRQPNESAAETGRKRANTTMSAEPAPRPQGEAPYVILRKFALSHNAYPFEPMREISHLHYASWPDFGVPANPSHLLALVELANALQRASLLPAETTPMKSSGGASSGTPSSSRATWAGTGPPGLAVSWGDEPEENPRPMLVHCSAGCGRTGTFCTVDSVVDMLKRQRMSALAKFMQRQEEDVVMDDVSRVSSEPSVATTPRQGNEGFSVACRRPSNEEASASKRRSPGSVPKTQSGESGQEPDVSWMDDEAVDLIQNTVEDFRAQRLSMVQSLRQYVLCYETVLEWIRRVQERGGREGGAETRKRSGSVGI